MNLFFDRNISVHIARMMACFDRNNQIVQLDDDNRFRRDDTDVFILGQLAKDDPKPVFVTADMAQRRIPEERLALRESGMTVVFFKGGFHNLNFHGQALKVLKVWPELIKACERAKVPTAFEVGSKLNSDKIDRLGATAELFKK